MFEYKHKSNIHDLYVYKVYTGNLVQEREMSRAGFTEKIKSPLVSLGQPPVTVWASGDNFLFAWCSHKIGCYGRKVRAMGSCSINQSAPQPGESLPIIGFKNDESNKTAEAIDILATKKKKYLPRCAKCKQNK